MVIDFYNRNGGGGGGTADYATLAGESNKSKLLEGGSALPQSGNTGDVVAVAPNLSKRGGAKGGETALGVYQYDGSAWNPIGGETPDFTSLSPVDEFPSSAKTGEVVAISSVNRVYDSVVIPSKTLAFVGNDVLTITTEYGTLTVNTYEKGGNIIYFETDDSQSSDIIAESGQSTSLPTNDENHTWEMEYDGDVYIRITENNTPVCVFSTDSLTDNTCFAYLGGNYEQIATLGLYQYDGSVWNQVGENGGDNTVLKAVSGAPATVEDGDVFAIHTPSADTQYEVSAWTNTEEYTISFDHHVQAIKVHIKTNGHFDFGFNNNDGWHDGFGFDIVADGNYGYVFSAQGYDSSRWEVSDQSVKFIASDWMAKTGGKTLYLDIREDNGDYYLYIYTEDVLKIWITDVAQNELDGEIQEGTVIPAHDAYDKTYQASNEELVELAKVTDLPAENRLVPSFDQHEDSSKVFYIDYWNGPVWQPQTDLVRNVFATYDGLGNHKDGVLTTKDPYTFKWDYVKNIHPITALPAQVQKGLVYTTEDGIFHAGDEELDTTNLYEIENHNDWDNPTGGTHLIISGSASADRVGFKFEGLSDDFMLIWNGSAWDYEFFENVTQENGNFTGYTTGSTPIEVVVSYDGTTDVFEIVCGEPWTGVYAGNDWSDFTSQYFVSNLPVTKYSRSVTSNSINSIVKLTQAEYDALVSGGTVDANTFYVIISPNS